MSTEVNIWNALATLTDTAQSGWSESALCSQSMPDVWFPEKGESAAHAKRICGRCEVQEQCLEYVMDRAQRGHTDHGVWGGLSEDERRILKETGELPAMSPRQLARADRYDLIRNLLHQGMTVPEVAATIGVERRTVVRAVRGTELERKVAA
jgi:WhiB family redox-sensing transcriptional regulator